MEGLPNRDYLLFWLVHRGLNADGAGLRPRRGIMPASPRRAALASGSRIRIDHMSAVDAGAEGVALTSTIYLAGSRDQLHVAPMTPVDRFSFLGPAA
jgi:hypothetical protein